MRHRRELQNILSLALPVIIAELGWMFMGVVDTAMVGHLGPTAIGAVSLGNAMFDVAAICGIGFLLGLDTLVSQSFGAQKQADCDRWLWQGLWVALITAPLMMLVVAASEPVMSRAGVNAGVLSEAIPYMHALNWSLPPLLLYAAFRRYLQGMSFVRPVMFALVSANVVNVVGNYLDRPLRRRRGRLVHLHGTHLHGRNPRRVHLPAGIRRLPTLLAAAA
jgi:multidrug resistance protein, MATE family